MSTSRGLQAIHVFVEHEIESAHNRRALVLPARWLTYLVFIVCVRAWLIYSVFLFWCFETDNRRALVLPAHWLIYLVFSI